MGTRSAASFARRSGGVIVEALLIAGIIVSAAFAWSVTTGRPLPAPGTQAAGHVSYAPTISVVLSTSPASGGTTTPYTVTGCGFDAAYGTVTIVVHSPEAISFAGQVPVNGCINVTNFSTQGAGHYDVDAYQALRKRSVVVASTSFDF